jgi:hypothetical protein
VVELSEIIVHEGDEPNVVAHLFDADALTGEDYAEIDWGLHRPTCEGPSKPTRYRGNFAEATRSPCRELGYKEARFCPVAGKHRSGEAGSPPKFWSSYSSLRLSGLLAIRYKVSILPVKGRAKTPHRY